MGSRLGRRVIHFANLPIKLQMPSSFDNIKEFSLRTIPSASKIEIKRVLESLYGFEVEKVRTLNMDGKKKHRGGLLLAKPDYKKAYVTLRNPLSLNRNLFPISQIEEEKQKSAPNKDKCVFIEEPKHRTHWLDERREKSNMKSRPGKQPDLRDDEIPRGRGDHRRPRDNKDDGKTKFPWSSMRSRA